VVRVVYALIASVVAGVLLAAVAFPLVGGLSLTAKAGADEFLVLPAELKTAPLPQRTRILAADGSQLTVLYRQNRVVAPLKVRIGVHTGTVISRDGDYFGRNVAMAARVGAIATGGEVLASSAVREALDDDASVRLVGMGAVEFKGLPGEHEIWRVLTR